MKIKEEVRGKIKILICNRSSTFLWHDNWHPLGPVMEKFGSHIVDDPGLSIQANVSDIIEEGHWKWPEVNSGDQIELKENVIISPPSGDNKVIWTPSSNGRFSINLA